MDIQMVNSAPQYITNFISNNHDNIIKIFEDEFKNNNNEILFCNCSEKENKIDIHSINEIQINQMIDNNTWNSFKSTLNENNKVLIIKDIDLDKYFLFNI